MRRKKQVDTYDNHSVRKVINKIADMVASTPIKHYSVDVNKQVMDDTNSELIWLLSHQANHRLTSFKFFKQMVGRVLLYNNSFAWIRKDIETGKLIELVPIITNNYRLCCPQDYPQYLYIEFTLNEGVKRVLPINEVIHFTGDFIENEYFGDNTNPLIEVVSINDDLWTNLVKWTQSNSSIKGFLKTEAILSEEDRKQAQEDFKTLLENSSDAFTTLDGKYDYLPLSGNSSPMDVNYIDKIESTIREFYSVNKAIIDGSATPQQIEAFHQICLNPIFTMIEQELESKLLTKKEILGFQHQIRFICGSFAHMTASERVSAYTLLTNQGAISRNELREGFGFKRLEGLDTLMYSKNFAEVGKTDETTNNENKEEEENGK